MIDVDPGAGHLLSNWRAASDAIAANEALSEGFRAAVCGAYEAEEDEPHIINDIDD